MRFSNLIARVEDKAKTAVPRFGRAISNFAHTAKVEVCARAAVVKVLMLEDALLRSARRAEHAEAKRFARLDKAARRRARQLVEEAEIADRAIKILNDARGEK